VHWKGLALRPSIVLRHLGKYSAIVGQISGVVVATVYVLRYENLNDWAVRLLGVGVDSWMIVGFIIIALIGLVRLFWPRRTITPLPDCGGPAQEV
jgi:hypothetical protein